MTAKATAAPDTHIQSNHPVWQVINRIYQDDDDHLLTYAADAVKAVKTAMLSSEPTNPDALVLVLDIALKHINQTKERIADCVHVMSGDSLTDE